MGMFRLGEEKTMEAAVENAERTDMERLIQVMEATIRTEKSWENVKEEVLNKIKNEENEN